MASSVLAVLALAAALTTAPACAAEAQEAPRTLAQTGLYADPATRRVDPRHIAFAPQYPLWTDGAHKRRWIALPEGEAIDASEPEAWRFPVGTRIWKEFAFEGRPVETRYMRRLPDGTWLYAAYAWSEDGAEAVLVGPGGRRRAHPLGEGRYHAIPGIADCKACHQGEQVPVLGFSALQLSPMRDAAAPHAEPAPAGPADLPGLVAAGVLKGLPEHLLDEPPRIPAGSAEERAALGYLHGNCGHCHNGSGPLASLGLVLRHPVGAEPPAPALETTMDVPAHRLGAEGRPRIAPGRPGDSLLLERVASRFPALQMPPLGTALPDHDAIALLRQWIAQLEPAPHRRTRP